MYSKGERGMFDWIQEFMEMFGCDWETAAACYTEAQEEE